MNTAPLSTTVATVAAGLVAGFAMTGPPAGGDPAPTTPDPADFSRPRANPYFPLESGVAARLRGTGEGERLRERILVTDRTREIRGITTTVVRDVVRRADGSLAEKTHDWYAADNDGNVWYFGSAPRPTTRTATSRAARAAGRPGSTARSRA